MFKIGEYIIYGNNGVCQVEDIGTLNMTGANKKNTYYTLKQINENGKIFAPVDTNMFMRKVISSEEAHRLIDSIPSIKEQECKESTTRLLEDYYKKLIKSHECMDLLTLIASANDKKINAASNGKKLGQIDERYLRVATALINDEFSIALGIPSDEVEEYIKEKLK